jgi:hypothetical protein
MNEVPANIVIWCFCPCARAGEVLTGAPLDNGHVNARQRQLARQHQPCRSSSGDHHRTLGHRHTPIGTIDNTTRISRLPFPPFWRQRAMLQHDPGLPASPPVRDILRVARSG